jgi:hypothetical protein
VSQLRAGSAGGGRKWLVLWDDGEHVMPQAVAFDSESQAESEHRRRPGSRLRRIAW